MRATTTMTKFYGNVFCVLTILMGKHVLERDPQTIQPEKQWKFYSYLNERACVRGEREVLWFCNCIFTTTFKLLWVGSLCLLNNNEDGNNKRFQFSYLQWYCEGKGFRDIFSFVKWMLAYLQSHFSLLIRRMLAMYTTVPTILNTSERVDLQPEVSTVWHETFILDN